MKKDITVIIISGNEAENIERAVKSGLKIGKVYVIDGGSNDRTDEIARKCGAEVIYNKWPGFSLQRKFALMKIDSEWIFFLDADEEISDELAERINKLDYNADGYFIKRKCLFLGKWIRHGSWGRDKVLRLFKRNKAIIDEVLVHEAVKINGITDYIPEPLLHYAQNDFETIGKKFTAYIPLMAAEISKKKKRICMLSVIVNASFSFIRDYFLRLGFLDGWQGFMLAFWGSISIVAKYAEAKRLIEFKSSGVEEFESSGVR